MSHSQLLPCNNTVSPILSNTQPGQPAQSYREPRMSILAMKHQMNQDHKNGKGSDLVYGARTTEAITVTVPLYTGSVMPLGICFEETAKMTAFVRLDHGCMKLGEQ